MKKCRDLMTMGTVFVSADGTALDAARKLRDNSVGFLPVCEPTSGRVMAVVTDRDLTTRMSADDRSPSQTPILEVSTRPAIACYEDTPLDDAEEAMTRHQISRLVVVDVDRHPIGVLSLTDLIVEDSGRKTLKTARKVLEREAGGPHAPPEPVTLTASEPDGAPSRSGVIAAEEIYEQSPPVQSRQDVITGGRESRSTKEFPR